MVFLDQFLFILQIEIMQLILHTFHLADEGSLTVSLLNGGAENACVLCPEFRFLKEREKAEPPILSFSLKSTAKSFIFLRSQVKGRSGRSQKIFFPGFTKGQMSRYDRQSSNTRKRKLFPLPELCKGFHYFLRFFQIFSFK